MVRAFCVLHQQHRDVLQCGQSIQGIVVHTSAYSASTLRGTHSSLILMANICSDPMSLEICGYSCYAIPHSLYNSSINSINLFTVIHSLLWSGLLPSCTFTGTCNGQGNSSNNQTRIMPRDRGLIDTCYKKQAWRSQLIGQIRFGGACTSPGFGEAICFEASEVVETKIDTDVSQGKRGSPHSLFSSSSNISNPNISYTISMRYKESILYFQRNLSSERNLYTVRRQDFWFGGGGVKIFGGSIFRRSFQESLFRENSETLVKTKQISKKINRKNEVFSFLLGLLG